MARRFIPAVFVSCLLAAGSAMGQSERDFAGSWNLDRSRSKLADNTVAVEPSFRVEQSASSLTIVAGTQDRGAAVVSLYPLDGRSEKYRTGNLLENTGNQVGGRGAACEYHRQRAGKLFDLGTLGTLE